MDLRTPEQDRPSGALDGVRVLDLTVEVAGPWATRLLADQGADVIKLERPGIGDPARRAGPFPGGRPDPEASGLFRLLNLNKRGITLDLREEAGAAHFRALVRGADVLVTSLRPRSLEAMGISWEALSVENPSLVWTAITNFGLAPGPYRDYEATDLVIYGMGGPQYLGGQAGREPLRLVDHAAEYHGGTLAAYATVLGLLQAGATGRGTCVDFSLQAAQAGSLDRSATAILSHQFAGHPFRRMDPGARSSSIWPCRDGYMEFAVGAVGFDRIAAVVGKPELLADPRFATPEARLTPASQQLLAEILLGWLMERTMAEAWAELQRFKIISGPLHTEAAVLADRHLEEREYWTTSPAGEAAVRMPGRPFILERTPWARRRHAPRLGEHNDELIENFAAEAEARPAVPRRNRAHADETGLPLAGVRVVEITNAMAAPMCAGYLGDWGAEVIRVESTTHWQPSARGILAHPSQQFIDGMRIWNNCYPGWAPGSRPWNRAVVYHSTSRSKLSMTADITTDAGREAFERLIAVSDVFIESNAPDVSERLGLTYDRIVAVNPRIVMLQMPAFGHSGPYRQYRAYGNHAQSFAALTTMRGYADTHPTELDYVIAADSAASTQAAFAAVVALRHRRRTGVGQRVEVALAESLLNTLGAALVEFQVRGRATVPRGNGSTRMSPHGTYRCAGEDSWVNICVRNDEEWHSLCDALAGVTLPALSALDLDGRRSQAPMIDAALGDWCRGREARDVMRLLQGRGIPAGVVNDAEGLLADPGLRARGFYQRLHQPDTGAYTYAGLPFTMSGTPNALHRYPPMLGEHNHYLYREVLGYSEREYDSLVASGAIGTEYLDSVP